MQLRVKRGVFLKRTGRQRQIRSLKFFMDLLQVHPLDAAVKLLKRTHGQRRRQCVLTVKYRHLAVHYEERTLMRVRDHAFPNVKFVKWAQIVPWPVLIRWASVNYKGFLPDKPLKTLKSLVIFAV